MPVNDNSRSKEGEIRTIKSSLPSNLRFNGVTCLPKQHGSVQKDMIKVLSIRAWKSNPDLLGSDWALTSYLWPLLTACIKYNFWFNYG